MRLISLKIWRAFPELDQYEDDVCRRYVSHAKSRDKLAMGIAVVFIAVLFSLTVSVGSVYFFFYDAVDTAGEARGSISITLWLVLVALLLTSVIWLPAISAFLVRDLWLRSVIRKQLRTTNCLCGYQLVGLEIREESGSKVVTCPECGNRIELNTGHITEADIDPQLLRCS